MCRVDAPLIGRSGKRPGGQKMRRLLWPAVVAVTIGAAPPAAAQEGLLQALRQGLNEEPCSGSRFSALQQLDEDIRSLEAAIGILRSLYAGSGIGVRFSRQPDNNYHLESDLAGLSAAIDRANAFSNYPSQDSIPRILAAAEAMLLPDMTSASSSDDMLTTAEKQAILLMFAYNVTHRLAAYCGHEPFGALVGVSVARAPSGPTPEAITFAVARAETRAEVAEARAEAAEARAEAATMRVEAAEARAAAAEAELASRIAPAPPPAAEWEEALGVATHYGRPDRTSENNLDDGSHYEQSSDDRAYSESCGGSRGRPHITGFNLDIRSNTEAIHWRWRRRANEWWQAYFNREHLGNVGERIVRVADTDVAWYEYRPPRGSEESEFIILIACTSPGSDEIDVHYHH